MSWSKLDDQFHSHPKTRRAWECRPALGLHAMALSYVAARLTDGFVDGLWVREKLPRSRERAAVTKALEDAGLWVRVPGRGWQIHDYLDYNPPKENLKRTLRKPKNTLKSSLKQPKDANDIYTHARPVPVPVPLKEEDPPNPPGGDTTFRVSRRGKRQRDQEDHRAAIDRWVAAHFAAEDRQAAAAAVGLLEFARVVPTVEEVARRVDATRRRAHGSGGVVA